MFVVFDRLWYNAFLFKEDWGRMRIGIVRLSAFGDVVIAASMLGFFRNELEQLCGETICLEWFVDERFCGLLEDSSCIDVLHKLPMQSIKNLRNIKALWARLRALGEYDVVLDMQGLIKSSLVGKALRSKYFVGFSFRGAREGMASLCYTKCLDMAYDENILVRNFALCTLGAYYAQCAKQAKHSKQANDSKPYALASMHGKNIVLKAKELAESSIFKTALALRTKSFGFDEKQALAQDLIELAESGPAHSLHKILFVLEASIREKTYPVAQFCTLAHAMEQYLSAHSQKLAIYLIYHNNKQQADTLHAKLLAQNLCAYILPKLDFNALKFVLSRMDCVIGGDTGVTHLAWALGYSQVITLYGNALSTQGKNMRETKLARVLLGNPYVLSESGKFEIASIEPNKILEVWKRDVLGDKISDV